MKSFEPLLYVQHAFRNIRLNPYLIPKELIGKVETHLNIQLYQVLWNVWIYFFPQSYLHREITWRALKI